MTPVGGSLRDGELRAASVAGSDLGLDRARVRQRNRAVSELEAAIDRRRRYDSQASADC